jgi:hypothetical protein
MATQSFQITVSVDFTEGTDAASFTGNVVNKINEVPGVTNVQVSQITTQ